MSLIRNYHIETTGTNISQKQWINSKYDHAKLITEITEPVITIAERIVSGDASVDCEVFMGKEYKLFNYCSRISYTVSDKAVGISFALNEVKKFSDSTSTTDFSGDIVDLVSPMEVGFLLYFSKQAWNNECDKRDWLIRIEKQKKRKALHDKYKALNIT